ncbi:RsmB/NOP family class I SAM-dependent RNA methyltransferase [Myxococcota bacterium]
MNHSPHSKTPGAPTAREIAAQVLSRVERDQAYASRTLDAELSRYRQLDARERGLATELTYGCLRVRPVLLDRLAAGTPRGLGRLDPWVLSHLIVAAYQLFILDRIPAFVAVSEAVEAIRHRRGQRLAGFANALLRGLAATGERLTLEQATWQSLPSWLEQRLVQAIGSDEAHALVTRNVRGILTVRPLKGAPSPGWLQRADTGRTSPCARTVLHVGDPRRLPGYAAGAFVVQEEGSQVVALSLGARAGERVLDACAGHGQKSAMLAEAVGSDGQLWATDLYPGKLRALVQEFRRLGLSEPKTAAVDWSVGAGPVPSGQDRVLVDAPCTGTGTLRRRPELAFRLKPEDPARLGKLGEQILRRAAQLCRPGGRVVYAVCSVLPEEGPEVIERVADQLEPVPFDAPGLTAWLEPAACTIQLLPGRHGTDGFFMASLTARR